MEECQLFVGTHLVADKGGEIDWAGHMFTDTQDVLLSLHCLVIMILENSSPHLYIKNKGRITIATKVNNNERVTNGDSPWSLGPDGQRLCRTILGL